MLLVVLDEIVERVVALLSDPERAAVVANEDSEMLVVLRRLHREGVVADLNTDYKTEIII